MVYEKQEKLRDVMRIQGLKTWVYWASWMASAMIQMIFLVVLIVCILSGGGVLRHTIEFLAYCSFPAHLAPVRINCVSDSFVARVTESIVASGFHGAENCS